MAKKRDENDHDHDDEEVLDVAPGSWATAPLSGEKSMLHEVPAGHVLPPLKTEPQGEVLHEVKDEDDAKR